MELAVGTRIDLDGVSIARGVAQTGGPVRVDSFGADTGAIAREARALGIRALVGCPIVVGGRLWGVVAASTNREEPFPADTEAQIARFTELVATAVANAEARGELRALAAEQATLRRVATLVARGVGPELVLARWPRRSRRCLTPSSRWWCGSSRTARRRCWPATGWPRPKRECGPSRIPASRRFERPAAPPASR